MKNNIEKIFDFLRTSERLKYTKRWKNTPSMVNKETSADHSWHLALLLIVLTEENDFKLDVHKALKMALTHDLVEAIADDTDASLIHFGITTKKKKYEAELKAIEEIKKMLPSKSGKAMYDLWMEYEISETEESKFVKALDKIEGINHMLCETDKCFDTPDLIAPYPRESVEKYPALKYVYQELLKRLKPEYKKHKWEWKDSYNIE
ncbi:MAG: HD domain-containing protein [Patescibacteria group bacterium]|jgi:putative hydrolase of HD superfamily